MQFSIKWLLAAVAYAAVVCTSVFYASPFWLHVIAGTGFFFVAICAVAIPISLARRRAILIGVVTFAGLLRFTLVGDWQAASDWRAAVDFGLDRVVQLVPVRTKAIQIYAAEHFLPDAPAVRRPARPEWRNAYEFILSDVGFDLIRRADFAFREQETNGFFSPGVSRLVQSAMTSAQVRLRTDTKNVLEQHLLIVLPLIGGLSAWRLDQTSARAESKFDGATGG